MKGERIMQNEWIVISEYCDNPFVLHNPFSFH